MGLFDWLFQKTIDDAVSLRIKEVLEHEDHRAVDTGFLEESDTFTQTEVQENVHREIHDVLDSAIGAASLLEEREFDVFLAHNSIDKPLVRYIAGKLKDKGLRPWLDEEQILPGTFFQDAIQQAINQVKSAAIFISPNDLGKWQLLELRAFISVLVEKDIPVIPVLLPGRSEIPSNLFFLQQLNWVAFPEIEDEEAFKQLMRGITGQRSYDDDSWQSY